MDQAKPTDELVEFSDETPPGAANAGSAKLRPWRILVVDDDDDVFVSTRLALGSATVMGRPLELIHANSARAALELLAQDNQGPAVILLDVVMETERAGLDIIEQIRNRFGLRNTRIILRTGQPGYAPELDTIRRYDINDYRTKSELTSAKLYASLAAALRAYDQLCHGDETRLGLQRILAAGHTLMTQRDRVEFCRTVIGQVAHFLNAAPDGLVCEGEAGVSAEQLRLISGLGRYVDSDGRLLGDLVDDATLELVGQCIAKGGNVLDQRMLASFLSTDRRHLLIGLHHLDAESEPNPTLLDVLTATVALNHQVVELITQLRNAAFVDALTGLPNHIALLEHLDRAIANNLDCADCRCTRTEACVLAVLDIDQFSAINDLFGHRYGDALLQAVARRLRERLDSVCHIARIGHDVFTLQGKADVVRVETLQRLFAEPFRVEDAEHAVTVSMGLVNLSETHGSGSDRLKDAWIALKHAKNLGQFQAAWYSADIGTASRGHARLLQALRGAFKADRLYLAYQPQIDFASGRPVGIEALLRWRGEDGRLISPADFIPVAESSGLIIAMGEWVLRTALGALAEIRRAGHRDIRVAVNVSVVQLCHPGFIAMLDSVVAEAGLPLELLELEITESVAIKGAETVETLLHAIRQRGMALALDDFGTGFSSLSYLDRLPADRIKIDRSFVEALASGVRGARIAELVIPLGHTLGMKVLAEGVETETQAERLRELGCHEAQGFLYARPMPLGELLAWLDQRRQAAG